MELEPRIWSDFRFKKGEMNFQHWDMAKKTTFSIYPLNEVKFVFEEVASGLQKTFAPPYIITPIDSSFKELHFRETNLALVSLRKAIETHANTILKLFGTCV